MAFTPSAKMIAKRRNIDVASLIDILSYRRPYQSEGEMEFLNVVIDNVDGMISDEFGNRYIQIGESNVMWSCHTDTVHGPIRDGIIRQNIRWDGAGNILGLNQGKSGQCLGADDGAGIWIMLEMIKARKEGLYIFHRGEECGGKGSRWIEKNTPDLLDGIDFAIAFDRKDVSSIITYQGGTRCCSDAFGVSLGAAISRIDGLDMRLDRGGSFTDTAVYTDLVAECTNVSVGYHWQHGPRETLDVRHMIRLRDAMLQIDPAADFVKERKAGDREVRTYPSYSSSSYFRPVPPQDIRKEVDTKAWGSAVMNDDDAYETWLRENYDVASTIPDSLKEDPQSTFSTLMRFIKVFPEIAVRLLIDMGIDQWDFADMVLVENGAVVDVPDADLAQESGSSIVLDDTHIGCENCAAKVDLNDIDADKRCPFCYASLEDPVGEAITAQNQVMALLEDKTHA